MDVRFVNPVLKSIVDVLTTMASLEPQVGKPAVKQGLAAPGIISGVIALKGSNVDGSVAISLAEPVILDIARRMLCEEFTEVDGEIQDLVGELTNMMAGGGKAALSEQGHEFELTLPRVLVGEGHEINHAVEAQTISVPFTTDVGEFHVEVCFKG